MLIEQVRRLLEGLRVLFLRLVGGELAHRQNVRQPVTLVAHENDRGAVERAGACDGTRDLLRGTPVLLGYDDLFAHERGRVGHIGGVGDKVADVGNGLYHGHLNHLVHHVADVGLIVDGLILERGDHQL